MADIIFSYFLIASFFLIYILLTGPRSRNDEPYNEAFLYYFVCVCMATFWPVILFRLATKHD